MREAAVNVVHAAHLGIPLLLGRIIKAKTVMRISIVPRIRLHVSEKISFISAEL